MTPSKFCSVHRPSAGAEEYIQGEFAFTCWDVSSTCRAREDEAPELVTEAAGIARARPVMEFILLSASSESSSHSTKRSILSISKQKFTKLRATTTDTHNVHVRKAFRQLSVQQRDVSKVRAILLHLLRKSVFELEVRHCRP